MELDDRIYQKLCLKCEEGEKLSERHQYYYAQKKYEEAWKLLPEPRLEYEAALWIAAALGDSYFLRDMLEDAHKWFVIAVQSAGGLGNPFVHLRLGQLAYEFGDIERAKDELTRAYMGGGREVFENNDPKYFELIQSVLLPPIGQSEL